VFGLLLSRHAGVMFSSTSALMFAALQELPDTRQVASVTVPPARPACQYNPQPTAQVTERINGFCSYLIAHTHACGQSAARWRSALQ